MAETKTLVGSKLIVQIESDSVPGTYVADCLINVERGIEISSETKEFVVQDCDNPSAPGFKQLFKDGMMATISGGGQLHTASVERWFNWMTGDTSKNVRFKIDTIAADGGGYISGPFKLTSFGINAGGNKDLTQANISLQSHGAFTWTDAV